MSFSRFHFRLILTLTFLLLPCTSIPTPYLSASPPSSLSAVTHPSHTKPSLTASAPPPPGDSFSPSPLKPAQTSPTPSPLKTLPTLPPVDPPLTDDLPIFPPGDPSGGLSQITAVAPGTDDASLGRSGLESQMFVDYCLMQCKKISKAERCGRRVTSNPFRTCKFNAPLGFEFSPTCCFWSRCYNMYGVTKGNFARRTFWREGVRKKLCRNQA